MRNRLKYIIVMFIMVVSSMLLAGCAQVVSTADQAAGSEFKNPDDLGKFLEDNKKKEEEPVEEEVIEDPVFVTVNISLNGYKNNGQQYAIWVDTENDPTEYTIVDLDTVRAEGINPVIKDKPYSDIADEYINYINIVYDSKIDLSGNRPLNNEELRTAIMREADILLYLEYFPEGDKAEKLQNIARQLAFMIYESADIAVDDIVLKYNSAAILAKANWVLEDFECKKEACDFAQRLWDEAENSNDEESLAEINRAWAAAELYRMTSSKTYRTIVEAISGDIELRGVSYDNPGYLAVFAYLSSNSSTSYDVSGRMMDHLFNDANARIKESREEFISESISERNYSGENFSDDFIEDITDGCKIVMMTQHISMSREYTQYAEDRILFLSGASATGVNYLCKENFDRCEPLLFTLCMLDSY